MIKINIKNQVLTYTNNNIKKLFSISTAMNGTGQQKGSFCTPIGRHIIRAMIGNNLPKCAIFKGRRWTGEVFDKNNFSLDNDYILTRILWLSGKEHGKNRLGSVDTMQRYIYIHGTHDEENIGSPVSHGCIRMLNDDIIELFNLVSYGENVEIIE
ncbi:MAG: L,D-transpeptidase [Nitrosomonadales bacterium]|jgi:L,D-transpeptidase YbiS